MDTTKLKHHCYLILIFLALNRWALLNSQTLRTQQRFKGMVVGHCTDIQGVTFLVRS